MNHKLPIKMLSNFKIHLKIEVYSMCGKSLVNHEHVRDD